MPSLTESLFDLGLGEALVGITDFCVYPAQATAGLPHLGGTKNPRIYEIIGLKPDLVLANWEENTRQTVEGLEEAGVPVWVTFPQSVSESMEVLWKLAELFHSQEAVTRLKTLEVTLDWTTLAGEEKKRLRYFCPIWQDKTQTGVSWWMTFNHQTYCHDLLHLLGGQNVFAERERHYPLEADLGLTPAKDPGKPPGEVDTRYPHVSLEEIRQAQPEVILLPSEPFAFGEAHRQELQELLKDSPAARAGRVHLVDGSLITWPGTRLARALRELPELLAS